MLEDDVADGDEERPPVLVERDDADHHEVVEVHLDRGRRERCTSTAEEVRRPTDVTTVLNRRCPAYVARVATAANAMTIDASAALWLMVW